MQQTMQHAQAALDSAKAAYLAELQRDCERPDGSSAQERRREEHQEKLRQAVAQCERDLEAAKVSS
jgi:hypothetical protein